MQFEAYARSKCSEDFFLGVACVKVEWIVNISEIVSSLHGLRTVYVTVAFHAFLLTCLTDWPDVIEMYYYYYLLIYLFFF